MHCHLIPDLPILSVGGDQKAYFVHAGHIFKKLLNKKTRQGAAAAMHSFFESKQMQNGGDLRASLERGPLTSMIYMHSVGRHGGGVPSYFLSLEGVKKIIDELPGQDEAIKMTYRDLFSEFIRDQSKADESIHLATPEQCDEQSMVDIDEEVVEVESNSAALVPRGVVYGIQLQSFMKQADAQLTLERERTAMVKVISDKELELEKERTAMVKTIAAKDKENAELLLRLKDFEIQGEKDKAQLAMQAKDAELEQMKKKLERAERAKKRSAGTMANDDDEDEAGNSDPPSIFERGGVRVATLPTRMVC